MVYIDFAEGASHGEICGNDGHSIPRKTRNPLKIELTGKRNRPAGR
jgi:hypothetical protein